jgi:hypothetical protein
MTIVLVLLLWVVCAGVAGMTAHYRDLPVGKFVCAGLLLGIVGVLWAAFATSNAELNRRHAERVAAAKARAASAPWLDADGR